MAKRRKLAKVIPLNQKNCPPRCAANSASLLMVRQLRWMVDPAIDLISSDGSSCGLLSSASLIATAGLMIRLLMNAPTTAADSRQAAGYTDPDDNGVYILE